MRSDGCISKEVHLTSLEDRTVHRTVAEEKVDFQRKIDKLKEDKKIKHVVIIWECHFAKELEKDIEGSNFLNEQYTHSGVKLNVRNLVRGGMNDCVRLFWCRSQEPGTDLHHLGKFFCLSHNFPHSFTLADINSCYAHLALEDAQIPTGKVEYLYRADSARVQISSCGITVDGLPFRGAIKAWILPPRDHNNFCSQVPILQTKVKDRIVSALCYQCAHDLNVNLCKHSEKERSFLGEWLCVEVHLALEHGYEIKAWEEIMFYRESKPIFSTFFKITARDRLRSKGFPESVKTEIEKQSYVDKLNAHHNLENNFALKVDEISKNDVLGQLRKLSENGFLGRWSLRKDEQCKSALLTEPGRLLTIANCNRKRICNFHILDKKSIIVNYATLTNPAISTNCQPLVGGYVPCYGRKKLWLTLKSLNEIETLKIMMWDTDSCAFSLKKGVSHNLHIAPNLYGAWKEESVASETQALMSLGCKSYVKIQKTSDSISAIARIKGITLNTEVRDTVLNSYYPLLEKRLKGELDSIKVPQVKKKRSVDMLNTTNSRLNVTLRNELSKRRFLVNDGGEMLLRPWGYFYEKTTVSQASASK